MSVRGFPSAQHLSRQQSDPLRSGNAQQRSIGWWALAMLVAGLLVWLLGQVLLMAFAAALLAVALRAGADRLAAVSGGSRTTSLAIVGGTLVAVFVAGAFLSGNHLADQGHQLWEQAWRAGERALEWLRQYSWGRSIVDGVSPQDLAEDGRRLASGIGGAALTLTSILAGVVVTVVAAFYFASAPKLYVAGLVRLLPLRRRRQGRRFLYAAGRTLRQWMYGQGIGMMIVAAASYLGLMLIGVPLAPLLAILAGLSNFIPYIGPVIGAAPALLVAMGESPQLALWVLLLFGAIQFVEGNLVEPRIQEKMTRLPPALTILSQTVFGTLFGALGVVLATPVLAVVLLGLRMKGAQEVPRARRRDYVSSQAAISRAVNTPSADCR